MTGVTPLRSAVQTALIGSLAAPPPLPSRGWLAVDRAPWHIEANVQSYPVILSLAVALAWPFDRNGTRAPQGTGPERSAAGLRTFTLDAHRSGELHRRRRAASRGHHGWNFRAGGARLLRRVTDDPGLTTKSRSFQRQCSADLRLPGLPRASQWPSPYCSTRAPRSTVLFLVRDPHNLTGGERDSPHVHSTALVPRGPCRTREPLLDRLGVPRRGVPDRLAGHRVVRVTSSWPFERTNSDSTYSRAAYRFKLSRCRLLAHSDRGGIVYILVIGTAVPSVVASTT